MSRFAAILYGFAGLSGLLAVALSALAAHALASIAPTGVAVSRFTCKRRICIPAQARDVALFLGIEPHGMGELVCNLGPDLEPRIPIEHPDQIGRAHV